jgi:hypothetical protein
MSATAIVLLIVYVVLLLAVARISFRRGYHYAIYDVVTGKLHAGTHRGTRTTVRRR